MKKIIFLALIGATLSGCLISPSVYRQQPQTFIAPPFDEVEYNALAKTGTGIVKGQVFAKTVGGDVKKGAGEGVILIPATKYGDLRYKEQVIGKKLLETAEDPRYSNYVLTGKTDGDGRFEFKNVPPGTYYLVSRVVWQVPIIDKYFGLRHEQQGGNVSTKIEVKNGATTDHILNYN